MVHPPTMEELRKEHQEPPSYGRYWSIKARSLQGRLLGDGCDLWYVWCRVWGLIGFVHNAEGGNGIDAWELG